MVIALSVVVLVLMILKVVNKLDQSVAFSINKFEFDLWSNI